MQTTKTIWAEVDAEGRLVIPAEIAESYGMTTGARLRVEADGNHLRLHRPVTHLAKIYLEPTNRCNINCRTCMRNAWDAPLGRMSAGTFDHILENISRRTLPYF